MHTSTARRAAACVITPNGFQKHKTYMFLECIWRKHAVAPGDSSSNTSSHSGTNHHFPFGRFSALSDVEGTHRFRECCSHTVPRALLTNHEDAQTLLGVFSFLSIQEQSEGERNQTFLHYDVSLYTTVKQLLLLNSIRTYTYVHEPDHQKVFIYMPPQNIKLPRMIWLPNSH